MLKKYYNKKTIIFFIIFLLDISIKLFLLKSNFGLVDFVLSASNYIILSYFFSVVTNMFKVNLDEDNNIFYIMFGLIICAFTASFIKLAVDVYNTGLYNSAHFGYGYEQLTIIASCSLYFIGGLSFIVRAIKFRIDKRKNI